MNLLEMALIYHKKGCCVIPVNQEKKPIVKWAKYQSERSTEAEIRKWWADHPNANIGIVTGEISGIAVIDIDTPEGKIAIKEYVPDTIDMPIANTPSGGWHYYFKCPDNKLSNNARVIEGCDLRANGGYIVAPPSQNGNGKRYAWLQGLSIFEKDLPAIPNAYLQFIYNSSFNSLYIGSNTLGSQKVTQVTDSNTLFGKGRRDNDLFHVANCLAKGGMLDTNVLQVLNILAKNCVPPFSEEETRLKVESAMQRNERRTGSLSSQIQEWIESQIGNFSVTQGHSELHLVTKEEKNNFKTTIYRLKKSGTIEPTGGRAGIYRKIDNSFEPLTEFTKEDLSPIDIKLPLKLHNFVKIFQANIIIIAGQKSCGKTGFALSFADMNFGSNLPIRYISSEFTGGELHERLSLMDVDPNKWILRVEFNRFRGEPQDAIMPNGINIVDFLEVKEGDFYKVGHQIDKIYEKLEKGIAMIFLQVSQGQELGRGGSMTLDKSRLYISLTREETSNGIKNYAKVIDCKNLKDATNDPNGRSCQYNLGSGHYFNQLTQWEYRPR